MTARKRDQAAKDTATSREIVVSRLLDAPRDHVWQLCTDPEHLKQWWGPKDFTVSALEMDLHPGGRWTAVIRSPEGMEYPQYGVYLDVIRPEELSFTFIWELEGPKSEMLCTLTLAERGAQTEVTFSKGPFVSTTGLASERGGWNQCFDRLVQYLERSRVGASQR